MTTTPAHWSFPQRLVFRFVFILLTLFILLFNNGTFPMIYIILWPFLLQVHIFIPWVAKTILHLPYQVTIFTNGSGDTTYDYLVLLCITVTAVLGAILWTILDRKRNNYSWLFYWLTVAVRFYVGFMLIQYGSIKLVQLQFLPPGFSRLIMPYGDSSPMGLAWTFLGFSKGYNIFMGIAEMMAGLLLFRRTVTFGAIMTLMASANVMAVNYFYDVPVKIVSTSLVLMSLFLLAPNIINLLKFFFGTEAVKLSSVPAPITHNKWLKISKYTFKYLVIAYVALSMVSTIVKGMKMYGENAPKSPLYGTYEIKEAFKDNARISNDNPKKWKTIMFQGPEHVKVKYIGEEMADFDLVLDPKKMKMKLISTITGQDTLTFKYELNKANQLTLTGEGKDAFEMIFTKKKFVLTERGFHWINEHPFNK
jgi:hypothetical protein